jgi:hypothetical protein
MSDRLSLMMYLFFVILIVSQPLPRRIKIIFSVLFISLHVILITKHSPTLLELNANAKTINETASHMEDNSIVLPVNLSDNWLQGHFSNYLGTDKPLVILENYEVNVGWFPLQWNANAPNILHGNLELVSSIEWPISHNKEPKQIDYIFLYGNCSKIEGEDWKKLKEIISANYNLFYESKNKYIRLYKIADLTLNKRK